tara:strand:+ start:191 stop:877 length:687 start_codon:yes stop_codon:yes gene_type:complete
MNKFSRIFLLLIAFIFLSTYTPNKLNLISEKKNKFFEIKNIIIENNLLLKKDLLAEKLNPIYYENIFFLKRKDVENLLKDIDFLKEIEVKKKYPNTLIVKIFETKPLAILFKDKTRFLLDTSSNLIFLEDNMNFDQLPSVFGDDAENNFLHFFHQLQNNNFPIFDVKNFYYFQIGRWDIQLSNNKIIKFPHNNTKEAIKESIELLNREDFKNYKIIDLRVGGKIIVEQ